MSTITLCYSPDCETISFAAAELERYLKAVNPAFAFSHASESSAANDCTIHLNTDLDPELSSGLDSRADDLFLISLSNGKGSIQGSNPRSVLLGMYAFLRRLGYRFLLPDETVMPHQLSLADLTCSYSHRASLRHRGVCIEGADSLENVLDFIDWLPKLGFNSFFLQFKEPYIFLERWYHHTLNPTKDPMELTEAFLQDCYKKMHEAMKKRSLLLHAAGHGWTCEAIGLPSIGWVPEKAEPSPKVQRLLALVNGKREYIDRIPMNTNLCYSDPDAIDRFCNTVVDYVKEHPETDYLHIWLADEYNHICECESCRKTTLSDQYVHLLNLIDQRLTQEHLDCKLVFLLYQELLYPPVKERFQNPDRFVLMFAPISRTFRESYPDRIQEVPISEYRRNQMVLPVTIEENLTFLAKWQKIFDGNSLVYDYPLGRAHYGDFGYVSISKVLAGDIHHVKNLHLDGYISCQELRAFLPNGLPNYVMGYLTLDTEESFDSLMDEYFQAAYGSMADEVKEYLTRISQLSDCDYFNHIGPRTNPAAAWKYQQLSDYVSGTAEDLLNRAKDSHQISDRFQKLLTFHREYVLLLTDALVSLASGNADAADEKFSLFADFVRKKEDFIQPYLDVYRIQEVAHRYTGFSLPEERTSQN